MNLQVLDSRLLTCILWYERETVRRWTSGFLTVRLWASGFMTYVGNSYYQYMINTPSRSEEPETVIIFVEVFTPHRCVMNWRIMFGKIIQFVGFSWDPVNEEVYLACSILDPIEYHVHCFDFFVWTWSWICVRQWRCLFLLVLEVVYGRSLWVWFAVVLWFVHYGRAIQARILQLMLQHDTSLSIWCEVGNFSLGF